MVDVYYSVSPRGDTVDLKADIPISAFKTFQNTFLSDNLSNPFGTIRTICITPSNIRS